MEVDDVSDEHESGFYELIGLITHKGLSANSGHYIGYSKDSKRGWLKFDDDVVTEVKEDVTKAKIALTYLFMLPRTPQMYYGTEILMDDTAKPGDHGLIRSDFPGGWNGDDVNAFSGDGLSAEQKEMQE